MAHDEPIYVSKPHPGSWGQEYRIYRDRIEVPAKMLFHTIRIPLEKVREIGVRKTKIVWSDIYRRPSEFWWTYNNDKGGDYHVYLYQTGWPSRIRFTPEDPKGFVAKCKELVNLRQVGLSGKTGP